jgi:hypothetical protein
LPSLVIAQSQEVAVSAAAPPSGQNHASWLQATYYSDLRRGTSEKAAVELVLPQYLGCFVTSPLSPMPGVVPLKLELEEAKGISITKIEYPQTFKLWTNRGKVRVADSGVIRFRIHTSRDIPLVPAPCERTAHFPGCNNGRRVRPPEQMEVQMRLTVVEHNAKVTKSWPYQGDPSSKELLLLLPVIIIYALFQSVGCAVGSGCSS